MSRQRNRLFILKLHHLIKGGEPHDQIIVLHHGSIKEQLQRGRIITQRGDRVAAQRGVITQQRQLMSLSVECAECLHAPQRLNRTGTASLDFRFQGCRRALPAPIDQQSLRGLAPEQIVAVHRRH